MNTTVCNKIGHALVLVLGIMASTIVIAHGGWHGGGYHGGGYHGGGWHGGGWHPGGYHGGGWYGGGYRNGGIIIGAPYYYGGGCQTVRVCNRYGNCWLRQNCY